MTQPPPDDPSSRAAGDEETVKQQQSPFATGARKIADPLIGTQVSGYVIKGRLGSGGMGIVYEGEQPMIGKRVAIKVLRPEVAEHPDIVQRLVAEARAVNQVGHRGIIDVFGFGDLPDGRQCIVMEFLDGEPLENIIAKLRQEQRRMPLKQVFSILDEALSALAAAHSAGVIHRDLKPSNIFLCTQRDGTRFVKLLDFGIAKLGVLGKPTPQTNASLMVGTPAYMAPEQARGGLVSPAMDLYAIGVVAFELLTGATPFNAESVVEMLMKHQTETPPKPSSLAIGLPAEIDALIAKLLEKQPEQRYASADDVREVVAAIVRKLDTPGYAAAAAAAVVMPNADEATQPMQDSPFGKTAITGRLPEQRIIPVELTKSAVGPQEPIIVPKSKHGLYVVLGVVGLALAGGAYVMLGTGTSSPVPPAPEQPAPGQPAQAAAPATPSPSPAPATRPGGGPPPTPPVAAKQPPTPAPEPVAAPPTRDLERPVDTRPPMMRVKERDVAAPVPVVVKELEPVVPAPPPPPPPPAPEPQPAAEPSGGARQLPGRGRDGSFRRRFGAGAGAAQGDSVQSRVTALEERLSRAAASGRDVSFEQRNLAAIKQRLADPSLTDTQRTELESALQGLERSIR